MHRRWILLGSLFALAGVVPGAFGVHGLSTILAANGREDTFQTAAQYQMYHCFSVKQLSR